MQSPRAMGWEEMVSRSHMFRDIIPVEEALRSSFLDLYKDDLFSFTIWDHALEALQELNSEDGRGPATSVVNLLDSFRPILSDSVMSQICENIEDLKNSKLGIETLFVQSKRATFSTILRDLRSGAYSKEEQNKSREPNGQVENGGNHKEHRDQSTSGVRTGGGESKNRTSGGGDSDEERSKYTIRAMRDYFQTVVAVLIEMPSFTTPPRNDSGRHFSIKERSALFSSHAKFRAHHICYSLVPIEGHQTCSFYHGTRYSFISRFFRQGIQPRKYCTEFSVHPAFYVTNDVKAAYEFPLFNHVTRPGKDPVVLFHFQLDLGVLHGETCTLSGHRFNVRVFRDDYIVWKRFCEGNMFEEEQDQHSWDIVIGPLCIPSGMRGKVTPRQSGLLQVAFCSAEAIKWASSSLVTMFKEERNE